MPTPSRDLTPLKRQSSASLLDTASFSPNDILELFSRAEKLKCLGESTGSFSTATKNFRRRVIGLLFFEPSTRTHMSFQIAAERLGYGVMTLESAANSSLSKGETLADTVLNIVAMKPDGLVIRYGVDPELDRLLPTLSLPVMSAGTGTRSHPTQALLDAFTIHRELGSLAGVKVLIVGDIRHSRVANSNFDVLSKLGAEIGVCGPKHLLPNVADLPRTARVFEDLDEACGWCDVYMGLRVQLERHEDKTDFSAYNLEFGLNSRRLQKLKKGAIIMHPGPINHGVEFSSEVMTDPRSRVLQQVSNGVLIRASLLAKTFEPDVEPDVEPVFEPNAEEA
jgi:aspartate carbamoyltransferase catalytic subunit